MFRKDNLALGFVLGFIVPVLGIVVYYFVVFYKLNTTFTEYLTLFRDNKSVLTGISSISLIANAIVFTFYINGGRDNTAKGIFLATVVYAIAVLLVKVIG